MRIEMVGFNYLTAGIATSPLKTTPMVQLPVK